MSGISKKLMSSAGAGGGFTAIEDVFSTYLYTGNGSTQTITNGIDLAGEGGLVWIKARGTYNTYNLSHVLSAGRGSGKASWLNSDTTDAGLDTTDAPLFLADGFQITPNVVVNSPSTTVGYASWTFRKAPRFFDVVTYTGTGSARTVDHNLGTTVGSIIIKRADTTSNWAVYHRGNTAAPETDFLSLNLTNATADDATYWNDTAPTDSVFTVGTNAAVNASGGTYVAYLFAHDPLGPSGDGSDGLIACGSYTGNSSSDGPEIDLGFEPQWVLIKNATWTGGQWMMFDSMRGMVTGTGGDKILMANQSYAESPDTMIRATPTGFKLESNNYDVNNAFTYIYIAIRRGPMRQPESGTEVFQPSYGLNASNSEIVNAGFPIDLNWRENVTGGFNVFLQDRMRGFDNFLSSNNTSAEGGAGGSYSGTQNGILLSATLDFSNWINWSFRRAPGFFDVVAYTGDGVAGRTVPHNLGVAPEMMIVKTRNDVTNWRVYHKDLAASGQFINLDVSLAAISSTNVWGDGTTFISPTDSLFTVGSGQGVNDSAKNLIWYGFATLAGISKVGSYTGNGSSQTINCGFTSSARFIIIKRTDSTGDWYVWDTARGIVAANDPHLSLNTTAAEVTTDDSVDPDSSGFIVNQVAATNINVSAASYIFYAVA